MDIVGPLVPTTEGHRFILTICDYHSRYPEAIPLKSTTTDVIAEALIQVFSRMGIPQEILTDRGSNFCSELAESFYKLMGIKHLKTSAYHPQCDGLVERFNATLKHGLKKYVQKTGQDWHKHLPYLLFAYRELPHPSTGHTPFELLYGKNPRGLMDVLREQWSEPKSGHESVVTFLQDTYRRLELAKETAKVTEEEKKKRHGRITTADRPPATSK